MRKVDTRAGLVKLWDQTSSLSDLAVVQFKIESSTFNILQHPLYCYTRRRRLKDRFDRIWTMLGTVHILLYCVGLIIEAKLFQQLSSAKRARAFYRLFCLRLTSIRAK